MAKNVDPLQWTHNSLADRGGQGRTSPLGSKFVYFHLVLLFWELYVISWHTQGHLKIPLVDLRGTSGTPPPGVQILSFLCNRQKICKIIPIWEFAHPLGKILDPPLDHSYISRIYRCLCRGRSRISRRKARTYKFPKNCIKLRKFWSVGGGGARRGHLPLDPPLLCLDILFNVWDFCEQKAGNCCSAATFRSFLTCSAISWNKYSHFLWDPDSEVVQGCADSVSKKTLKSLLKVCKIKTTIAVSTVLILFIILFVSKSQI